jgi:hypothetical protein
MDKKKLRPVGAKDERRSIFAPFGLNGFVLMSHGSGVAPRPFELHPFRVLEEMPTA